MRHRAVAGCRVSPRSARGRPVVGACRGVLVGRALSAGAAGGPPTPRARFGGVLAWAAVSLAWSSTEQRLLALIPLVLAALVVALAALAVEASPREEVVDLMVSACGAAVVASTVHALVYGTPPGGRLALPLGPASALHLPTTLCAAVLVAAAVNASGARRWAYAIGGISALFLTVAASSRAGTAALVLLVWLVLGRASWTSRRWRGWGFGAVVVSGGLLALLLRARPETGLIDGGGRSDNTLRGLAAWVDGGWAILPGRGSSSVWP